MNHTVSLKQIVENGTSVSGGGEEVNGINGEDDDGDDPDEEEEEFNDLLAELGINGLVEDTETIRAMWLDLKRNDGDPVLMENYETFLAKMAKDIQQKAAEQQSLECTARMRSVNQGPHSMKETEAVVEAELGQWSLTFSHDDLT